MGGITKLPMSVNAGEVSEMARVMTLNSASDPEYERMYHHNIKMILEGHVVKFHEFKLSTLIPGTAYVGTIYMVFLEADVLRFVLFTCNQDGGLDAFDIFLSDPAFIPEPLAEDSGDGGSDKA